MLCHVCKTRINCCFCSSHPKIIIPPMYLSFSQGFLLLFVFMVYSLMLLSKTHLTCKVFRFSQRWTRFVLPNTTQAHHTFFIPSSLLHISPELCSALWLELGTWPMTENMGLIGTDIQMQTRMNANILGGRSKIQVTLSCCHSSRSPEAKHIPWPIMPYHFPVDKEVVSGTRLPGEFGS